MSRRARLLPSKTARRGLLEQVKDSEDLVCKTNWSEVETATVSRRWSGGTQKVCQAESPRRAESATCSPQATQPEVDEERRSRGGSHAAGGRFVSRYLRFTAPDRGPRAYGNLRGS
jgi:hypothetical protein